MEPEQVTVEPSQQSAVQVESSRTGNDAAKRGAWSARAGWDAGWDARTGMAIKQSAATKSVFMVSPSWSVVGLRERSRGRRTPTGVMTSTSESTKSFIIVNEEIDRRTTPPGGPAPTPTAERAATQPAVAAADDPAYPAIEAAQTLPGAEPRKRLEEVNP